MKSLKDIKKLLKEHQAELKESIMLKNWGLWFLCQRFNEPNE